MINAGVEGARALTHEYPTDAFDGLMAVNLRGSWLCLKHLLPLMLAAGRDAAAVITSSTAGKCLLLASCAAGAWGRRNLGRSTSFARGSGAAVAHGRGFASHAWGASLTCW